MKRENSNLEVQTTLDARPGQLPALERWLQLNGESFRRWPGLTNIEWARVPGRESISLRLAYASFPALERNYERWAAAAEMMERTLLARAERALRLRVGDELALDYAEVRRHGGGGRARAGVAERRVAVDPGRRR